jgi:site-specific DNA recombinase
MQNSPTLRAALYARVSSEQQSKQDTIASQLAALHERGAADGLAIDNELSFVDDGVSGGTLLRPALERLRDAAAGGAIDRLYVLSPDRLARNYAHQVVLVEELVRAGVDIIFVNRALGDSPEEKLLLQMQGMIAEYERAKIAERCRRGKRYAAQRGSVNVLTAAPFGYRYVSKQAGGGQAAWLIVPEEARLVRQMFEWLVHERASLAAIARRLVDQHIPTRTGKPTWNRSTVGAMLKNSAYQGAALFGKTRNGPRRPRLRPLRGTPATPRRAYASYRTADHERQAVPVPAIVSPDLFAAAQEQLADNRKRYRGRPYNINFLLRGLTVCQRCGYAYVGAHDRRFNYTFYRCCGNSTHGKGCGNSLIHAHRLEAAVWNDVRALLADPERIEREYHRRLDRGQAATPEAERLDDAIHKSKRAIARLIDAYEEGLLDKSEFTTRLSQARERLTRLQAQFDEQARTQRQDQELRLIIACLEDFRQRIAAGLDQADAAIKRDIISALVKRIQIEPENVRIIYKIAPPNPSTARRLLQDCPRRYDAGSAWTDCCKWSDCGRSNWPSPNTMPTSITRCQKPAARFRKWTSCLLPCRDT